MIQFDYVSTRLVQPTRMTSLSTSFHNMGSCKAYLAQEAALAAGLAAGEASEVVADAGNVKSDSTAKRRSGLACISTGNDTLLNQWLTFTVNFWVITYYVGKAQFELLFRGPLAE